MIVVVGLIILVAAVVVGVQPADQAPALRVDFQPGCGQQPGWSRGEGQDFADGWFGDR